MTLTLTNNFTDALPSDPIEGNFRRKVLGACYSYVEPKKTKNAQLIHFSEEMAVNLGLDKSFLSSPNFIDFLSGNKIIDGSKPYSLCYGGHQFGHWAGQLGDGRAINLGQLAHNNKTWTLQLKGSGETPYSRSADGLAVLRSSIREHLCSEAMFHLGIPTTRSLSLVLSGDEVLRDVMYDGHPEYEKGAIVCRVSPSFLRFGSFEIFAARGDVENLKTLADYTIKQHFPSIKSIDKLAYIDFFQQVFDSTIDMILEWERVGFVHGVMNTDNMSILGLTIDYGPYGWLEGYDENWTPNTTDKQFRRYRYGNQAGIAYWNLAKLANALVPLIGTTEELQEIIESFQKRYTKKHLNMLRDKLGLESAEPGDALLIQNLKKILQKAETDMTIFFRRLSEVDKNTEDGLEIIKDAFYEPKELSAEIKSLWLDWFSDYQLRLELESRKNTHRVREMNLTNPKYVLRNYMAQLAIDKANEGDYSLIKDLYNLLKKPYDEQIDQEKWFAKRPEWARNKVGCSMLSCSS